MTGRPIDNATTMTGREYADHRGVDPGLISRWKKAGRLVLDSDGKILARASDAVLDRDLHPARGGRGGTRLAANEDRKGDGRAVGQPAASGNLVDMQTYSEAARLEKLKRVRLLDMEIAERCARLVDRDAVERQAFSRARQAMDALLAITDRLAPQIAAESDPHRVHVLLDTELRRVAQQIAESAAQNAGGAAEPRPSNHATQPEKE